MTPDEIRAAAAARKAASERMRVGTDPLQPRITEPVEAEPAGFGDLTADMTEDARAQFGEYIGGVFNPAESKTYAAMPESWNPKLRATYATLADLGLAALTGVDVAAKGAAGLVGEASGLLGASEGSQQRLARDLAAIPEAFAGSPASLGAGAVRGRPTAKPTPMPSQAELDIAEATGRGIRTMTSDVVSPESFAAKWAQSVGERIPVAGTGGQRAAQQAERISAVEDVARQYGATAIDDLPADIVEDLAKTRSTRINNLRTQKSDVISGVSGEVPMTKTIAAIDEEIANLRGLQTKSVEPAIAMFEDWKKAIQGQDLEGIERLRGLIGEAYNSPDLAAVSGTVQKATNRLYGPIVEDMGDFIKDNGQRGDFAKWRKANKDLSEMVGELENSALKAALKKGDVTPEVVERLIFSKKKSDVKTIYRSLSDEGKAKVQSAIIGRALRSAGAISPEGQLNIGDVSPDQFAAAINRLGPQVGIFFSGKDKASIDGLMRALETTKRAGQAGVAPPTGVQNFQTILGMALVDVMGGMGAATATGGGIGALARIYEGPRIRDGLARLARTKPGSADEEKAYKALVRKLEKMPEFAPAFIAADQVGGEDGQSR